MICQAFIPLTDLSIYVQNYALFPHMSVAKNIGYGLARAGISGADYDDRIAQMLKLVRLEALVIANQTSYQAGKNSVLLWRALLLVVPNYYYWTSLWPLWIKNCAKIHNLSL